MFEKEEPVLDLEGRIEGRVTRIVPWKGKS